MKIFYKPDIDLAYQKLVQLSEAEVSHKPANGKWSKKEILGHLCDSAINNYYRFMQIQASEHPVDILKYDQREWVRLAKYQDQKWKEITQFWNTLNTSICNVVEHTIKKNSTKEIRIDREIYTYQYLVEDYFKHLQHHLNQILANDN